MEPGLSENVSSEAVTAHDAPLRQLQVPDAGLGHGGPLFFECLHVMMARHHHTWHRGGHHNSLKAVQDLRISIFVHHHDEVAALLGCLHFRGSRGGSKE